MVHGVCKANDYQGNQEQLYTQVTNYLEACDRVEQVNKVQYLGRAG
jgi:hypothetical protein